MHHARIVPGIVLALLALVAPVAGQAPREGKPGGVLRLVLREDLPQGFALHETATNSVTWPAMPCYSNLVIFDQLKQLERPETIVPELAERWSWQDGYRNLVFFLRRDVRWHDGRPFTAKDVKFTFDMVREAKDAPAKLRINPKRPPFDNVKVRRALSLAIDRRAYEKDLVQLPGYGRAAEDKARARKLLAEAGFGPANPLKVEMATRAIAIYLDFASFVVNELKQVGLDVTLKQIDTAQWHPMVTRREYQIGANLTGLGVDDPDANFYENYACGSPRNYGDYCDEQVMRLIEQQSQEVDPQKRLALVWQIQKKLEEDAARPTMGWRTDRFAHWPHVRNLVPHNVTYNWARHQETWLDR